MRKFSTVATVAFAYFVLVITLFCYEKGKRDKYNWGDNVWEFWFWFANNLLNVQVSAILTGIFIEDEIHVQTDSPRLMHHINPV